MTDRKRYFRKLGIGVAFDRRDRFGRTSPANPADWAVGFYKGECNGVVAGVSRKPGRGGGVHAILCCD